MQIWDEKIMKILGVSLRTTGEKVFFVAQMGFLACLFISYPLWFPVDNIYPAVPVFSFLGKVPVVINYLLSALFISLFFLTTSKRFKQRGLIIAFLGFMILAVLFDYLRIQPWVFYFFFIFLSFAIFPPNKEKESLNVLRLIFACIYFWSGAQKLNYTFLFDTYLWLIEPVTYGLADETIALLSKTALSGPLIEIFCGLGLLFKKTQKVSMYLLVFMHGFILLMIGPLGHNANVVIWPWNVSFAIILILLFRSKPDFSISKYFRFNNGFYKIAIFILFALLPVLSFFNLWPMYFSSALYSSNKEKTELYLPDQIKERLPKDVQAGVQENSNGLILNIWTQYELDVANYPSSKVHKKVFKKLCESYPEYEMEMILLTKSRPDILTGETVDTTFFCDEM